MGLFLTIILVLMDLLTYFFYPKSSIGEIFLATREQTPLTWVSAVVLLLIAISSATAYFKTKSKIWYFLSAVFFFFSMDDATYFHERFSGVIQEQLSFIADFPSYGWVILYLPFLMLSLFFLVYKLWKDSSNKDKKILVLIVLGLFFALSLDMIDGWAEKSEVIVFCIDPICNSNVAHIFRLVEETVEVISFGGLAYMNISKNAFLKG